MKIRRTGKWLRDPRRCIWRGPGGRCWMKGSHQDIHGTWWCGVHWKWRAPFTIKPEFTEAP